MDFLSLCVAYGLLIAGLKKYSGYKTQRDIRKEREDDLYLMRLFNVLEED